MSVAARPPAAVQYICLPYSKGRRLFYQQIGFKFEEETSKMLNLERGFVWC
jgi:hypothetical protein